MTETKITLARTMQNTLFNIKKNLLASILLLCTSVPVLATEHTTLGNGDVLISGGDTSASTTLQLQLYGQTQSQQLAYRLPAARFAHTATVLPDGKVWIHGGVGSEGKLIRQDLVIDIVRSAVTNSAPNSLLARQGHTATLLSNGQVLIAGGVDALGQLLKAIELWNPLTGAVTVVASDANPRRGGTAQLLADGSVLLFGGTTAGQTSVAERFDPASGKLASVAQPQSVLQAQQQAKSGIVFSDPAQSATGVTTTPRIALRFSRPFDSATINLKTVTLWGVDGVIPLEVNAVESGMLAFITPQRQLLPGQTYTLFLSRVADKNGEALDLFTLPFTTAALNGSITQSSQDSATSPTATSSNSATVTSSTAAKTVGFDDDDEIWVPSQSNWHGAWRSGRIVSADIQHKRLAILSALAQGRFGSAKLTAQQSSAGATLASTSISGHLVKLNGMPLSGASVSLGAVSTQTDADGRFVLSGVPAGIQEVVIDGTKAGPVAGRYGQFVLIENLVAGRQNELKHLVWMPKVDQGQMVDIPSPTTKEVVLTHPAMPGLEVHIPKGMVIKDRQGKIVTRIGLTPMALDTAPFETPANFPVYFTLQPGGATIMPVNAGGATGATVIYPNYTALKPGEKVDFWNYSSARGGWHVYGQGSVTPDAKQIVPASGVVLNQTMGYGFYSSGPPQPGPKDPPNCPAKGGDPVTCNDGAFTHQRLDMAVKDVMPLTVARAYNSQLAQKIDRVLPFGAGMSFVYGMRVNIPSNQTKIVYLETGNGSVYSFNSSTTDTMSSTYVHTATGGALYGATIVHKYPDDIWVLSVRGGSKLIFSAHGANGVPKDGLASISDKFGNTIQFNYSGGALSQIQSPSGRTITFKADSFMRIKSATDQLNRTVTYDYEPDSNYSGHPELVRLTKVTYPDSTTEQYVYDANTAIRGIQKVIDRRGYTMVVNQYDTATNLRVTQQTLADGAVVNFNYVTDSTTGKITETDITSPRAFNGTADAGSFRRVFTFDTWGRTVTDTRGDGSSSPQKIQYDYNQTTGFLDDIVDALGRKTVYQYDMQGNVTQITVNANSGSPVTTNVEYDSRGSGNLIFAGLPTKVWTFPFQQLAVTLNYDDNAQLQSVQDPQGKTTTFGYSDQGLLLTVTNPNNKVTTYQYDATDLASITDANNVAVNIATDLLGRVASMRDGQGNATRYAYDNNDYPAQITDAYNRVTSVQYDALGDLLSVTDPKQHTLQWAYDSRQRLQTRTDRFNFTDTFSYDTHGNVRLFKDRLNRTSTATYDELDRIATVQYPDAQLGLVYVPQTNLLKTLTETRNGTTYGTYSYAWDALDRLQSETTSQGSVSYGYDNLGRRTSLAVKSAGQADRNIGYGYDTTGRLQSITEGTGSPTVQYGYDNANRLQTVTLGNGLVINYGWNDNGSLASIGYNNAAGGQLGNLAYGYDAVGGRNTVAGSWARQLMPTAFTNAQYDAADRLMSVNSQPVGYDGVGHLTSYNGNTYVWDSRNRLTQVQNSSSVVVASYDYDPFGRRTSKTLGGATTGYLYDGSNTVSELAGSNTAQVLPGAGIDNWLTRTDSQGRRWLLPDGLGSTLALADDGGAIRTNYTYEAYGEVQTSGDSSANPYQYTGRENDGNGLYFYRARYYSPTLKRFLSEDPMDVYGGGANLHAYVGGQPTMYRDPSGNCPWCVGAVLGGGIDLAFQLWQNGGRFSCVDWWSVAGAAAMGAVGGFATEFAEASAAARGTGAFWEGAEGGTGLGKLAGRTVNVSEKGVAKVEQHLSQFGDYQPNADMVSRLRNALSAGESVTGADASFYTHELAEATKMGRGMSYEAAHAASLEKYGVDKFSVYHPDVILANPGEFASGWYKFWGM
ncbi:RHS repeat-associated core domain-containing protein [Andreprevotia chitinilytica]|uniref:RHS repeat-associated core domain-containing protein n=1 Tax=Andreprevotia chitinilytica TaxID=396808 RepID=UPI00055678E5|nr:RHS repeat-associated core domain-containing protein [Andreprevotia chitinilytica]